MKKISVFVLFFVLITLSAFAGENTDFVRKFTDEALNGILSKPISLEKKSKLFSDLFDKCTSMDMISSFALGRKMKTLSATEKESFKDVFKKNVVLMWTLRFTEYKDQHFEFIGEKISENGRDVFVSSKVVSPDVNTPPMDVIWRIRKDKNGELRVIDIIISDISMLKTYQTEYASFLNQNDGDIKALIDMLKNKNSDYLNSIKSVDMTK